MFEAGGLLSDMKDELQGENGLGSSGGCRPKMKCESCVSCRVQGQDTKIPMCMDFLSITVVLCAVFSAVVVPF
jgi:hypothetical protein